MLGGAFGLVMRLRFVDGDEGCTVTAEVMKKVPFAVLVDHHAGFVHAERALRMAAKAHGVREVLAAA